MIGLVLNVGLQPKKYQIERSNVMNIGLIAHDSKKTLMQNFCIAYRGILSKHNLYATGTTGQSDRRGNQPVMFISILLVHLGESSSLAHKLIRMILMH